MRPRGTVGLKDHLAWIMKPSTKRNSMIITALMLTVVYLYLERFSLSRTILGMPPQIYPPSSQTGQRGDQMMQGRSGVVQSGSGTVQNGTNSGQSSGFKGASLETIMKEMDEELFAAGSVVQPIPFDPEGSDVLLFLHIQKTGGSQFELHLVFDTITPPPCSCKKMRVETYQCQCLNSQGQYWMFQRQNTGWPCGLHADFTVLSGSCPEEYLHEREGDTRTRKYHMTTILRDPIHRFLSEYAMATNTVNFMDNILPCDGRLPTEDELHVCHKGQWIGVTLQEFLECSTNPAFNRMTRMLANLSLSDCYRTDSKFSQQEREEIMLRSAKHNLVKYIEYFGLVEYQKESAMLLESTFQGLKLNMDKYVNWESTHAMNQLNKMTPEDAQRIQDVNKLDLELYKFAKDLFMQRLSYFGISVIST